MARLALLFLVSTVFSSKSSADPSCTFSEDYFDDITATYSCNLVDTSIQSDSDVLLIGGDHVPGYGDLNVTSVTIDTSSIVRVLNNEIFAKFENLERLTIESVRLERFGDQAFGSCSELVELIVNENPLSTLQARVFANCTKLERIEIWDSLNNISREAFFGLKNLVNLDLSYNKIASLEAGVFDHNPALSFIDLSWSKLIRFEPFTFTASVVTLWLHQNPIKEIDESIFANAHALTDLGLNQCEIRTIHPDAFKNTEKLMFLSLQSNRLESFASGTFTSLINLESIYLSSNRIKRLDSNAFGIHPNLSIFEIEHNELDEVEEGFFNAMPGLTDISVYNNTCVNFVFNISTIPDDFAGCYANWVSSSEFTTQGVASVKLSGFLIVLATFYTKIL